jgi:hypothetical protein
MEDLDIYVLDFSGKIDLENGLSNIQQFEIFANERITEGVPFKLLVDFRNTEWDSTKTHDALAKLARKKFNPGLESVYGNTAILNNQFNGSTFPNEYWFMNEDEALNWLLNK